MISPTHISFVTFLYFTILALLSFTLAPQYFIILLFFSLFPDIDNTRSIFGRFVPTLSKWLYSKFGHRSITHSYFTLLILSVLLIPLYLKYPYIYFSILVGWVSHIFLDTCTVSGVKIFYPFTSRSGVFPYFAAAPKGYRAITGGFGDKFLMVLFLAGSAVAFPLAKTGYRHVIRYIQKNVKASSLTFTEYSGNYLLDATIEGITALEKKIIKGTFPCVGAPSEHSVLLDINGVLYSFGDSYEDNILSKSIRINKSDSIDQHVREYDMSGKPLSFILSQTNSEYPAYLFGELSVANAPSIPTYNYRWNSVKGSKSSIVLSYARPKDLIDMKIGFVKVKSGIVTVKTLVPAGKPFAMASGSGPVGVPYSFLVLDTLVLDLRQGQIFSPGSLVAYDDSIRDEYRNLSSEIGVLNTKLRQYTQAHSKNKATNSKRLSILGSRVRELNKKIATQKKLAAKGLARRSSIEALESERSTLYSEISIIKSDLDYTGSNEPFNIEDTRQKIKENNTKLEHYDKRMRIIAGRGGLLSDLMFSKNPESRYFNVSFVVTPAD